MLYYYELFSVNSPRAANRQVINANSPEEAVQQLKTKHGEDLQFVYDEDFKKHFYSER